MGVEKKLIGIRLKNLRKEMKISQSRFADSLGVTTSCVANWETGIRTPDVNFLGIIAEHFGVSVDYVCCRSNQRNYFQNSKPIDPNLHLDLSGLSECEQQRLRNYYDFLLKKN